MEWNLNIPKILHLYWGGGVMPYIRYLTIKSFMDHNPDWKIMLSYPKYPNRNITWITGEQNNNLQCDDYFHKALELPIEKIEVNFEDYGVNNNISEVHKSDFIRLSRLSTIGGLWSDMDIIYFKPMSSLYFNTIENSKIETVYCNHIYGHSIGFLMGSENNKFFSRLMALTFVEFNPHQYQSIGSLTYNKYYPTFESINNITPAINMSMDVVYSYNAGDIPSIIYDNKNKFTEDSIGIHWYAGDPRWTDFINKTNGGLINLPKSIIGKILENK